MIQANRKKPEQINDMIQRVSMNFYKMGGQLFCEACSRNVGSSSSAVQTHITTQLHATKMRKRQAGSLRGVKEWVMVMGFGRLLAVCNQWVMGFGHPLSYKRHMPSKESRFAVNNRLLIT
jgi:hypothetical protein